MKKTRRRRRTRKKTGGFEGAGEVLSMFQSSGVEKSSTNRTLFTMLGFGLSAFLIGPLYLLSEFLNIPVSSVNLLSRKAFDKNQEAFLHLPLYKAIQGCPTKLLKPEKFALQDDMYINQDLAVVSCDRKVSYPNKVKQNDTHTIDSILDLFNLIPDKRRLQHYVFQLFHYIENIRATDEDRKEHIHKLIRKVNDYKTMVKTYLIFRTLKGKCSSIQSQKTILKDEDTVQMVNPFYIPCNVPFNTRIKCAWKHLYKSRFGKADEDCHAPCETCTFRNSLGRLTRKYTSFFSGGCNASVVRSMINTYFSYIKVGKDVKAPTPETLMEYLNSIPLDPHPNAEVDEAVYQKFETFICKYDIMGLVEKELTRRMKERLDRGYTLEQILKFIRDDSKQVKA
jgi:hypothetical protein